MLLVVNAKCEYFNQRSTYFFLTMFVICLLLSIDHVTSLFEEKDWDDDLQCTQQYAYLLIDHVTSVFEEKDLDDDLQCFKQYPTLSNG